MKSWFVLINGEVQGPFSAEEVKTQHGKAQDLLIWGKGHQEWMTTDKWQKVANAQIEESPLKGESESLQWKYRVGQKEFGPLSFQSLLQELRKHSDFSNIDVKSDKDSSWKDVYSSDAVTSSLGITRRNHPRVPIMGTLECEQGPQQFQLKIISISQGGMGATGNTSLSIGENFKFKLESPHLMTPVYAMAEVVFVGTEGYIGTKFINLPLEAQALIVEYVKKFQH